jgi:hypothetical protein
MAGPDFRVELDLGGGIVVSFALTEEEIARSKDSAVQAFAASGDRKGLRSAGLEIVRRAVGRNRESPLVVIVDEEAWVVPTTSIRAARFRDPSIRQGERAFGFTADRLLENT